MTLTETLQIKERFLQLEDLRAMDYCEKRWQQEGRPTTRWEMVNFIERMLQELQQKGIGYPKVLLLRKKEIQRRTFTLQSCEETNLAREPENFVGDDACPECQGRCFVQLPDASPTLCLPCLGRGKKIVGAGSKARQGTISA